MQTSAGSCISQLQLFECFAFPPECCNGPFQRSRRAAFQESAGTESLSVSGSFTKHFVAPAASCLHGVKSFTELSFGFNRCFSFLSAETKVFSGGVIVFSIFHLLWVLQTILIFHSVS